MFSQLADDVSQKSSLTHISTFGQAKEFGSFPTDGLYQMEKTSPLAMKGGRLQLVGKPPQ
jgi:hypothetical protein